MEHMNKWTNRQQEKSTLEIERDVKFLYLSGVLKRGVGANDSGLIREYTLSRIDPTWVSISVSMPLGLSRQPRQVLTMAGANDYRRQGWHRPSVRNSPSVSVTKSSHARTRSLIDYGVYGARVSRTVVESPSRGYLVWFSDSSCFR